MSDRAPVAAAESARSLGRRLARHCAAFKGADRKRSLFQILNTGMPFILLIGGMWFSLDYSYWLTLLLAVPAAGFLVRLFTIQHDCGHGSFFRSRRGNDFVGRLISVLTLTPYSYWRRSHAVHHATAGDLSRRGVGDVDTLTVREYRALPLLKRLAYRAYRNPLVVLFFGPPYLFLLRHRSPFLAPLPFRDIWRSILAQDMILLIILSGAITFSGVGTLLMLYLPVMLMASWAAGWLFYVQHQFEHVQWAKGEDWDFYTQAIQGSSYFVLPPILQWFTGNIGFHHIHHLCSKIPNYRLEECMKSSPELQNVNRITLRESLGGIWLGLWDEDERRLVSFREAAIASR